MKNTDRTEGNLGLELLGPRKWLKEKPEKPGKMVSSPAWPAAAQSATGLLSPAVRIWISALFEDFIFLETLQKFSILSLVS